MKLHARMFLSLTIAGFALAAHGQANGPRSFQTPSQPPAQSAPTLATVFDRQVRSLENEFVAVAEAMPEDKYNFAPSEGEFKGVRTFAQQVKHVATANYMFWGAALGEKPPETKDENGPDSIKSKADILQFLKDSFAWGHRAANSLTMQNELEMVPNPFGKNKIARIHATSFPIAHAFDHYGQMVEYLRMNGVIPPASRPRP